MQQPAPTESFPAPTERTKKNLLERLTRLRNFSWFAVGALLGGLFLRWLFLSAHRTLPKSWTLLPGILLVLPFEKAGRLMLSGLHSPNPFDNHPLKLSSAVISSISVTWNNRVIRSFSQQLFPRPWGVLRTWCFYWPAGLEALIPVTG